jgi:hypothetical protein
LVSDAPWIDSEAKRAMDLKMGCTLATPDKIQERDNSTTLSTEPLHGAFLLPSCK